MVLHSNPCSKQPYGLQRPGIQSNTNVSKGRNTDTNQDTLMTTHTHTEVALEESISTCHEHCR